MRVLVLGGDGFLGSHFVDQAVKAGHEITVFDRFPYLTSKNLEHQRGKVRFISGEFASRDTVSKALEGQDIVYHFICSSNPAESWHDPFLEINQNLTASIQFFQLAALKEVRKIVFPSSGGTVYGPQEKAIHENTVPRPFSPYGIIKLTTEYFLNYIQKKEGIKVDIYRIGNAYGPRCYVPE
ncbi:NAD-dependent epimerase/dehydratase family protein [candidate division KSB1 bacterium]|nr:NAD-dependent epimerase/dehydratase family protein [candidate division KSB1 bacterium]